MSMKGQVTLPTIFYAFLLIMVVAPLLPALSGALSDAVPYMSAQDKLVAYLLPTFFLLGPLLMVLGYDRLSQFIFGRRGGGEGF